VGGQVVGVVTSAGGSADLVLSNESTDSDVSTGDGDFTNTSDVFVGLDTQFFSTGGGSSSEDGGPQVGDSCLFLGQIPGVIVEIPPPGSGILVCLPVITP
jgi:hypothetical protein